MFFFGGGWEGGDVDILGEGLGGGSTRKNQLNQ